MLVFMGPVSLVAGCQQMLDFAPTTSLVGSGEKLATDLRIGQPMCCGLCREPFLSGAVALLNSVGVSRNVAICGPHEIRMVLDHTRTECEKRVACWSGFALQVVHRFKSL
jgi:hypothetical protein